MAVVGYARVSTGTQNLDRQVDALKSRACEKIFIDKQTGKNVERTGLTDLKNWVREGDTVVVLSADRLARNTRDLINLIETWKEAGVSVEFINQPMLNTTEENAMSGFMRAVLGAVAELELSLMHERQKEGIEAARKRGVYDRGGWMNPEQIAEAKRLIDLGVSKAETARRLGFSRRTIYRAINNEGVYATKEDK